MHTTYTNICIQNRRGTQIKNEMNRALGHFCAHTGWFGPGEPPEDDEMSGITLHSRHRIRPGSLRPSTLPLGHGGSPQYWVSRVDGEETFLLFFQTAEKRTPNSGVKGSRANHYPKGPAPWGVPSKQESWANAGFVLDHRRRCWCLLLPVCDLLSVSLYGWLKHWNTKRKMTSNCLVFS